MKKFSKDELNKFPKTFGIYLMKNSANTILYIGKAKNIQKRLKQYFANKKDSRATINILLKQVFKIDTIVVDTEKEALILENNLIKKHQPKYNILLKDDKTYVSLMLTKHKWPTIKIVRKKHTSKDDGKYFGPYTNAIAARKVLDLIFDLFHLRQCSDENFSKRERPCILYDIKKCIAPCVKKCSHKKYLENLEKAIQLIKGENKNFIKDLKLKMKNFSKNLEFEKAKECLDLLEQLKNIFEKQNVANLGVKDLDVFNYIVEKEEITISKLLFRKEKLIGSENFSFSLSITDDFSENFLLQHYSKLNTPANEIILPEKFSNKKIIEDILSKKFSKSIKIKIPIKGKKLKFLETAYNNAKAYFIREKKQKTTKENILLHLEKFLNLSNFPKTIECFDISNISQTDIVGSMVTFVDGIRDKKRTKKFIIKTKDLKGDCPALKEILTRHYSKVENFCDLTIIDGAKAQLNAAKQVFDILNIASIDLISISKDKQKHTKGLTEEKIHILNKKEPIEFLKNSPPLFLLQEIRDEAHMVAISFHKKRRKKRFFSTSLTKIPGIGEIKYKLLLKHFKSLENLKKATRKDLENLKKISKKDIENIFSFLNEIS